MKIKLNLDEVNLPDFMIVGAGKSGTTSLHYYLEEHPDVYMPWCKETWFFHLVDNPNKAILKKAPYLPINFLSYVGLYADAKPDQICGDATPSYLYYHDLAIQNIKKFHPEWSKLKIIIILREPIDKVISQYKFVHTQRLDPEKLDLKSSLRQEGNRKQENKLLPDLLYVDTTLYYAQVKHYLDTFENVKIFLYEDLKNNPEALVRELYNFVGINPEFKPAVHKIHNKSEIRLQPRNAFARRSMHGLKKIKSLLPPYLTRLLERKLLKEEVVSQETYDFLKNAFREDVKKLQGIISRDISHWLARYE